MLDYLEKHKNIISISGVIFTIVTILLTNWIVGLLCFIIFGAAVVLGRTHNKKNIDMEEVRDKAKVLFVDDKKVQVVKNLERDGFSVKKIDDVEHVNDKDVKWANIIFIDNKGVGIKLVKEKEGLGLAHFLKENYKNKKRYIIYSGDQDLRGCTGDIIAIRKNASPEEFMALISAEFYKL